jgi:hypothetical protein
MTKLIINFSLLFLLIGRVYSQPTDIKSYQGSCGDISYVTEGTMSEDLSKNRVPYKCDLMTISYFDSVGKHLLINFLQKQSISKQTIGFGGVLVDENIVQINNIYFGQTKVVPKESYCKLFYKNKKLDGVSCGGLVFDNNHRTVPNISFNVTSEDSRSLNNKQVGFIGYMKNKDGDEIYLTNEVCVSSVSGVVLDKLKKMYKFIGGKEVDNGCYGLDNSVVKGIWNVTKTQVSYQRSQFTFK